jgi:N-acetylglucosamine repressor
MIEALLRRLGPVSRARIHALTGIRLSATSQLVRELLAEGRVEEAGIEESRLGRKGVLLQLNADYRSIVGIEFDDETVSAGVTDLRPALRLLHSEPTRLDHGRDGLIRQLLSATKKAIRKADALPMGIGIADPGLVDRREGVTLTSSTIPFWKDVPLREIFTREFALPVLVETRTRAKAVAEHQAEPAESGATSMIYIDYGSGIGAGLYVDGRLLYGQGSAAGEFGHTHVAPDGPVCSCGSFGCLEAVAGLRAVESRVRRILSEGGKSEVLDLAHGKPHKVTGWMVFEAASRGDKVASNIAAEVARSLGLGIANLVNLFNPGLIVLDSRLAVAGPEFLDQIVATVRRQALREASAQVRLRYANVREGAGVLGVAGLVLDQHFQHPPENSR